MNVYSKNDTHYPAFLSTYGTIALLNEFYKKNRIKRIDEQKFLNRFQSDFCKEKFNFIIKPEYTKSGKHEVINLDDVNYWEWLDRNEVKGL